MESILRGLLGLAILVAFIWFFSSNRKAIDWKLVAIGLTTQFVLALSILKFRAVETIFEKLGQGFVVILDFTKAGTEFLFPGFLDFDKFGFVFAFQVLPSIIFFSALTSLLYYLGIIQIVVRGLAWLMTRAFRISGAESLSVAGNIFLGQTESPLLVKKYLDNMTRSEIMLVMIGGMATMAGGVLAAYVAFLGGDDPVQKVEFAKHLLAASVMAAPGAVVAAKILVPQTEEIDSVVEISEGELGSNALDAISKGTSDGLRLAANIGAMLLVFIAFIAMANYFLNMIGGFTKINNWVASVSDGRYDTLSLQVILGYLFAPIVWAVGVVSDDVTLVGRLLGEKLVMTEFIGYLSLSELKTAGAFTDQRSIIISTYLLCGFANFASIGIQIGGIGLLAPSKRELLAELGMRALLGGTVAALFSATMVGMII